MIGQTRAFLGSLLVASDMQTLRLAHESLVKAYFDRPRVILVSAKLAATGNQTGELSFATDLHRDTIRGIVFPGQDVSAGESFQGARGILESFVEGSIFPEPTSVGGLSLQRRIDTPAVFAAAADQGIPLVGLAPGNSGLLDTLQISDEARARISAALQAGKGVIVPTRNVMIGGSPAVAWYEYEPTSGELIGVGEDGNHSALAVYAGLGVVSILGLIAAEGPLGELAGQETFAILQVAYRTELAALSKNLSGYSFSAAKRTLRQRIRRDVSDAIELVDESLNNPLFKAGFKKGITESLRIFLNSLPTDPPVPSTLVALPGPEIDLSFNDEEVTPAVLAAPRFRQRHGRPLVGPGGESA